MEKYKNFISYDTATGKLLISAGDIVCSHIFKIYGEAALKFIDPDLIDFITIMMQTRFAGKYMLINNYVGVALNNLDVKEPISEERGLRCNCCYTVITKTRDGQCYVNPHTLGKAIDFDIYDKVEKDGKVVMERYTPKSIRSYIKLLVDLHGTSVRLDESDTDWIHLDTLHREPDVRSEMVITALGNYTEGFPKLYNQTSAAFIDWSSDELGYGTGSTTIDYSSLQATYTPENLANVKPEDIQGIQHLRNLGASEATIRQLILTIAIRMGAHPNWLMCVIMAESGGDPAAKCPGSSASGLIQFMEATANELGTTTAALRKMTVYEQLGWVDKFYQQWFGGERKVKNYWDVYMATFMPAYIGKPLDFVIAPPGSKYYNANKGCDTQKKGYITVGDMARRTVNYGKDYGITV